MGKSVWANIQSNGVQFYLCHCFEYAKHFAIVVWLWTNLIHKWLWLFGSNIFFFFFFLSMSSQLSFIIMNNPFRNRCEKEHIERLVESWKRSFDRSFSLFISNRLAFHHLRKIHEKQITKDQSNSFHIHIVSVTWRVFVIHIWDCCLKLSKHWKWLCFPNPIRISIAIKHKISFLYTL